MGHLNPQFSGPGEDGRGWGGAAGSESDHRASPGRAVPKQHRQHGGSAAQMGDARIAQVIPDLLWVDRSQQRWVPPVAVTAQGNDHPLQWNIGNVQRYFESESNRICSAIASACRYAPRWWYITPLGRAVVPLV